jgi:hypothetical protein
MKRYLFILLLLMPAVLCSFAVPVPSPKVSIGNITFKGAYFTDPEPSGEFNTLVIPIKRAFNLIIIQAKVDTLEGNFVLDTGAPYLVLNQTYFRDAAKYQDQESAGINGDAAGSFQTIVRNFDIAELHFDRLQADVTDLSGIENSRGIKVLGLLGTKLFAKFAITIDLFQNVLYIHKLDKNGDIPPSEESYHDPILKMPFYYTDGVIFLKGSVNDTNLWFAFDTGAETNLLDYRQAKKLMPAMQIISRSKLTGVGGSSYEVLYARFDKLVVGERTFTSNRVLITSLDKMGKAYGQSVDGILGYDFFTRAVFTINFVKKEFSMYENKSH